MTKRKKRKKGSNSSDLDASIGNEDHKPEHEDSGNAHEITMSTSKEAMEIFAKELISQYNTMIDLANLGKTSKINWKIVLHLSVKL